jgi:hypothetical protein
MRGDEEVLIRNSGRQEEDRMGRAAESGWEAGQGDDWFTKILTDS